MDVLDERILQLVNERKSIEEMRDDVGLSVGEVHKRLVRMEKDQLVVPPKRPHMARARRLTKWGEAYLNSAGYAKIKLWDE